MYIFYTYNKCFCELCYFYIITFYYDFIFFFIYGHVYMFRPYII
ncbi:hypothetical protein PFFCH_03427 [Plasmodium falciparum FCH/4]|uniref:Uncharacterized protein n=2 Tax=Plasmodium falciparum TaxID=5833 RepID=A0A024VML0_PLAFA|nr:hypothetical protein PFFCH_03427 [Plasmodium falciparum FCH/4]ETW46781.1 hypothetical protein PFMALIP_05152 [Plasmodium falciparum MaliPS096_E11]